MLKHKQLYLLLLLATISAGAIFAVQIINTKKITITPNSVPILSNGYFDILIEEDDYVLGNPGAPLTVVLFNDFSCPTCKTTYNEITKFVNEHPQNIRLFLKETPRKNLFYKTNDLPYRSSFCAGKQNKYWEYLDVLNTQKNISSESDLTKIANELKINTISWWQCVNSDAAKQKIARTISLAESLGIEQVPTIYINNKKINLDKDINIIEMLSKFIEK